MIDTKDLRHKLETAQRELAQVIQTGHFCLTVPVKARDSDILLGDGLQAGFQALAEVERLREEIVKVHEELYLEAEKNRKAAAALEDPEAVRYNILTGKIKIPADLVWLHDDYGPVAEIRKELANALGGVR